jgi:hypothetical protein
MDTYNQVQDRSQPQAVVIHVRARPQSFILGLVCVGLGVVLTLASLTLFAPQPAAIRPSPGSAALVVTMDDTLLSQAVGNGLATAQLPVIFRGAQAHAAAHNQMSVSAQADFLVVTVPVVATAQLMVANGHLTVHTIMAKIGGLALPGVVTSALDTQINRQLARATPGLLPRGSHYTLTGVTTTNGTLILSYAQGT